MVKCINTANGITGGPVCQGDIKLQLTSGGVINSSSGFGLQANNTSSASGAAGLYGKEGTGSGIHLNAPEAVWGDANNGFGVAGTSNNNHGIYASSVNAYGVSASSTEGLTGVYGSSASQGLAGIWGEGSGRGLFGVGGGTGVHGIGGRVGVYGESYNNQDDGVFGQGKTGVHGVGTDAGVVGTSDSGIGVSGSSQNSAGLIGQSYSDYGVVGLSTNGIGVSGTSSNHPGVVAGSGNGPGIVGLSGHSDAAQFYGSVYVAGLLTKAGGGFKIDHPLEPANKYLSHSFVESPEMKNVYDGVVLLDANGEAIIELPTWFEALNHDFRYQLTPIGAPAPNLHIAQKISNNRFKIAGGELDLEVSWQVIGIRKDPWAEANRLLVEEEKPANERDYYLHPEVHGQPSEKGIAWARHEDVMRRLSEELPQNQASISPTQQAGLSEELSRRIKLDEIMQRLKANPQDQPGKDIDL